MEGRDQPEETLCKEAKGRTQSRGTLLPNLARVLEANLQDLCASLARTSQPLSRRLPHSPAAVIHRGSRPNPDGGRAEFKVPLFIETHN